MKKFRFKSMRSRLVTWFLILAIVPLITGMGVVYYRQASSIKENATQKLTAVRDLKVEAVNAWLDERINDVESIAGDPRIRDLEQKVIRENLNQDDIRRLRAMERDILSYYLEAGPEYREVFIIDSDTGKILASTNPSVEGTERINDTYFTEPMRTRQLYIKDVYYSETTKKPAMTFSAPIFCLAHNGKHIVGILVARMDLGHSLYTLLLERTGMGRTGETLIVNKDLVALNELMDYKEAPLKLKIKAEPARNAAMGRTGIIEATDYQNTKVLAAYTHIPRTGWGFVAKQDMAEIYAPIKAMMVNFIILIFGTILAAIIVAFFLSRYISTPLTEMAATTQKMRKGNFSARNLITGADELAGLAETFNTMAESIELHEELRKINDEITQTLVDAKNLEAFRVNILKKLVKVTGSQMGAYFRLDRDTNIFEPFSSIGVTPGLLKPFDSSTLEGELGMVVEKKKITSIKDIPEDSIFKFRTFTGTILPKEIISIPIIIDDVVSGIVCLASIKPYPEKVLDIMEQPWTTGFGTALSNMWANAETKKLVKELEESNQELQSQSEELQQQSEELQEQNVELEVQRQQVEEANRLKSEFMSNMSHELRTPLNSVMALSRVIAMQAGEKLSEEEMEYLEIIGRNGKKLLSLINDILDLSKIEAGRMDVTPKPFSVTSTIGVVVESLSLLAKENGTEMKEDIAPDLPNIESDEGRVYNILQNLAGNAVKFTRGGNVTVSARGDAEKIHVEVRDTGIGIPSDALPYIFDEFRQVDGSTSRQYEGTGLGLAIAYKTARLLGGDISVESTLGAGSTFTLTLPVACQGLTQVLDIVTLPSSEIARQSQKTVLVVDDDPAACDMISGYLSQEGYRTITAQSGREALRLAEKHHPFAITLDIIMPEMDGFETLQRLKETPATKDIPVIVVSISEDRETGFALGATGYIAKPVDRGALISEISRIGGPAPDTVMIVDDNEIEHHAPVTKSELSRRILLVEDNEAAIIQVKAVLENEGYIVDATRGGKEALDYIKETIPDGIILDLMMPDVDGFEVLENIRGRKETARIPVLILTAKDLTRQDMKKLSANNIQQLIQKGDVDREGLLFKTKLMLGTRAGNSKLGTRNLKFDTQKSGAKHRETRNPQSAIRTSKTPTILIVEDNPDNMTTMKALLKGRYNLTEATDGEEGLRKAIEESPDLVLLDIALPGMDGYEVAKKIRKKMDNITIIAVTGHAMKGDREAILDAGFADYVSKPVDPEEILEKIEKWLLPGKK